MSKEIEIHIAGMIYNQSLGGTYSLVLVEHGGLRRRFSVLIGEAEAQSIALHLNNTKSPRPLSHDLMHNIIRDLNAKLIKVVIYQMTNDIFYSEIHLLQADRTVIIDSRTSDAVAIAVRSNAPIFIKSEILDTVGAIMSEENEENKETPAPKELKLNELNSRNLKNVSKQKLQKLLDQALEEEKYEIAALIRDELEKRN